MLGGIGAGGQLAFHCRLGELVGIHDQGANRLHHLFHSSHDAGGVAADQGNVAAQITDRDHPGNFADQFGVAAKLPQDDPSDKKPQANSQKYAYGREDGHDQAGTVGQRTILFGGEFRLGDFQIHHLFNGVLLLPGSLGRLTLQYRYGFAVLVGQGQGNYFIQLGPIDHPGFLEILKGFAPLVGEDGFLIQIGVLGHGRTKFLDPIGKPRNFLRGGGNNNVSGIDPDPLKGNSDIRHLAERDGNFFVELGVGGINLLYIVNAIATNNAGNNRYRDKSRQQLSL